MWSKAGGDNKGIFYVLKCWNEEEEFYKVGKTCQNSIGTRYAGSRMPYTYEIIVELHSDNRRIIHNAEKSWKNKLKEYHYNTKIKFNGSSGECFKIKEKWKVNQKQ